jgi:AcrR family transcriptional regulator
MSAPLRSGSRVSGRASPLAPEDRRAALVATTLPLVLAQGRQVTTRQIAQACGVAEGTIFRVFPDKDALIDATIASALDPAPLLAELAAIDLTLPLRARLTIVIATLQQRLISIFDLVTKVGLSRPPGEGQDRRKANDLIHQEVIRLLRPDRAQFRMPVAEVARLGRLLTFSGSHPLISDGARLTPEQIVGVLLDGVLRQPNTT